MTRRWQTMSRVVLDLETTGTDVETARIWEIGLRFRGGPADGQTRTTLVNPGCPIPADVVELCQLTSDDLEAIAQAESFGALANKLSGYLHGRLLIGHGLTSFDLPILVRAFTEAGLVAEDWTTPAEGPAIDTLVWARHLLPELRSRKLLAVAQHLIDAETATRLGLVSAGEHRTRADVRLCDAVLEALTPRLPEDLDELLARQTELAAAQAADFDRYSYWLATSADGALRLACGKHAGTALDQVDPGYLSYVLKTQASWKDGPLPAAVDEAFRAALARSAT